MLFSDALAKIYLADEENTEKKWYSFVFNVLVFKWFESQTDLMNSTLFALTNLSLKTKEFTGSF